MLLILASETPISPASYPKHHRATWAVKYRERAFNNTLVEYSEVRCQISKGVYDDPRIQVAVKPMRGNAKIFASSWVPLWNKASLAA